MSVEALEELLARILDYLDANFPRSSDDTAYVAETYTVPSGSSLTVTFRVASEWLVKVRHLYVDAAPNCSYLWTLSGMDIRGNEVTFIRAVELKAGSIITLTVTNTGLFDQTVDVLVEGWARRVVA
jgi:hypothetical protein